MMYEELVKALLYCEFGWSARTCDNCEYSKTDCQILLSDAAAAIEELWADNNILHQHIEDMNEAFRDKSVECQQAAKRNAELHAELERWVSAAEQAGEPKRGEWIHGKELSRAYVGNRCVEIVYEDFRCSACGVVIEERENPKWKYCPNCGAKMDGEVEHG